MVRDFLIVYEDTCEKAAEYLLDELLAKYPLNISKMDSKKYFDNKEMSDETLKPNKTKMKFSEANPVIFLTTNYRKMSDLDIISKVKEKKKYDVDDAYSELMKVIFNENGILISEKKNKIIISAYESPKEIVKFKSEILEMKTVIETNRKYNSKNKNRIVKTLAVGYLFGLVGLSLLILRDNKKRKNLQELQSLLGSYYLITKQKDFFEEWLKEYCIDNKKSKSILQFDGHIFYKRKKDLKEARRLSSMLYFEKNKHYAVGPYTVYKNNSSELSSKSNCFIGNYSDEEFSELMSNKNVQRVVYNNENEKSKIVFMNNKLIIMTKYGICQYMMNAILNNI